MKILIWVVVNRFDFGDVGKVRELVEKYGVEIVVEIFYSENIVKSYVEGKFIVLMDYFEVEIFKGFVGRVVEFFGGGV